MFFNQIHNTKSGQVKTKFLDILGWTYNVEIINNKIYHMHVALFDSVYYLNRTTSANKSLISHKTALVEKENNT